jgi:hypothetical protein
MVSAVCGFTTQLHRVVALCGLILGLGGGLVDVLHVTSELLDTLAVIVGYALGFSLLAIAPVSLLAFLVCRSSKQLVAQNVLVWIFIGTLWLFTGEVNALVTIVLLGYALTVLVLWRKDIAGRRPGCRS